MTFARDREHLEQLGDDTEPGDLLGALAAGHVVYTRDLDEALEALAEEHRD